MQHTITVNVSDCTEVSSTENITVIRLPFSIDGFNIIYEDYIAGISILSRIDDTILFYGNETITYDIKGNIIITINEEENK